jgi:type II secretory pathway pseudopilin PulG
MVTVAIVAALIGVLLPAVQAAREAARRGQCLNNVKQLSLAMQLHADAHRHFPTGGWGWEWAGDPDRGFGKGQTGGWIYNVLPFIEQEQLRSVGMDGEPEVVTTRQRAAVAQVLRTPLAIAICPTRRGATNFPCLRNCDFFRNVDNPQLAGRSDYVANAGTGIVQIRGPASLYDANAYPWPESQSEAERHFLGLTGISFVRSTVRPSQVADGLTHTLMISEKNIDPDQYETGVEWGDNETWCTGFNDDNYRSSVLPPLGDRPGVWGSNGPAAYFGAAHANVWNVASCDGSARAVSYAVSEDMLQILCNRDDGLSQEWH